MSAKSIQSQAHTKGRMSALAAAIALTFALPVLLPISASAQTVGSIIATAQTAAVAASVAQTGQAPVIAATTALPKPVPVGGMSAATRASMRNSPTIAALDQAQRAHFAAEVAKSIEDATRPPASEVPVAVAVAASAPTVVIVAEPRYIAPPPDTTKTVLAIYGPVGREMADIQLPSGEVVVASVGWTYQGYRLVRVEADAIQISAPASKAKHRGSYRQHRATHRAQPISTAAAAHEEVIESSDGMLVRVAVGGTFK